MQNVIMTRGSPDNRPIGRRKATPRKTFAETPMWRGLSRTRPRGGSFRIVKRQINKNTPPVPEETDFSPGSSEEEEIEQRWQDLPRHPPISKQPVFQLPAVTDRKSLKDMLESFREQVDMHNLTRFLGENGAAIPYNDFTFNPEVWLRVVLRQAAGSLYKNAIRHMTAHNAVRELEARAGRPNATSIATVKQQLEQLRLARSGNNPDRLFADLDDLKLELERAGGAPLSAEDERRIVFNAATAEHQLHMMTMSVSQMREFMQNAQDTGHLKPTNPEVLAAIRTKDNKTGKSGRFPRDPNRQCTYCRDHKLGQGWVRQGVRGFGYGHLVDKCRRLQEHKTLVQAYHDHLVQQKHLASSVSVDFSFFGLANARGQAGVYQAVGSQHAQEIAELRAMQRQTQGQLQVMQHANNELQRALQDAQAKDPHVFFSSSSSSPEIAFPSSDKLNAYFASALRNAGTPPTNWVEEKK
jgi:hypothetical protein